MGSSELKVVSTNYVNDGCVFDAELVCSRAIVCAAIQQWIGFAFGNKYDKALLILYLLLVLSLFLRLV